MFTFGQIVVQASSLHVMDVCLHHNGRCGVARLRVTPQWNWERPSRGSA